MFLLNLGYKWNLHTEVEQPHGVVVLPQGNSVERLIRGSQPDAPWILLDPQLYLAGIDATSCRKVCTRLAGFPWFGVEGLPAFDSSASTRTAWEQSVREVIATRWPGRPPEGQAAIRAACLGALEFQQNFGCTHMILPTPLVTEREDEAGLIGEWLDAAVEIATQLEMPQTLLASVAVSEIILNDGSFARGGALETIVDQVTAREGIDGVYIVVVQTGRPTHPFFTSTSVCRAYAQLTSAFASRYGTVVTNFADAFGLACLGAGATAVASGPSQSLRRLSLQGLEDEGGGRAFPHLYSHACAGEFLTETDLNPVVAGRLVPVVNDSTPSSTNLMTELARGGSAANVPDWAESQNNLAAAYRHLIQRFCLEAARLMTLAPAARRDDVRSWLLAAQGSGLLLRARTNPGLGKLAPAGEWVDLLDRLP